MITLLVIFSTAVIAGALFWLYNRRQVLSLTEQVEDKAAVINAFRSYSETANAEWNGSRTSDTVNLTPTVEEALNKNTQKNRKNSNGGRNKNSSSKTKNGNTTTKEITKKQQKPKKQN
jgi:hypothetical protein